MREKQKGDAIDLRDGPQFSLADKFVQLEVEGDEAAVIADYGSEVDGNGRQKVAQDVQHQFDVGGIRSWI